jgi:hypothetical protein
MLQFAMDLIVDGGVVVVVCGDLAFDCEDLVLDDVGLTLDCGDVILDCGDLTLGCVNWGCMDWTGEELVTVNAVRSGELPFPAAS